MSCRWFGAGVEMSWDAQITLHDVSFCLSLSLIFWLCYFHPSPRFAWNMVCTHNCANNLVISNRILKLHTFEGMPNRKTYTVQRWSCLVEQMEWCGKIRRDILIKDESYVFTFITNLLSSISGFRRLFCYCHPRTFLPRSRSSFFPVFFSVLLFKPPATPFKHWSKII